MAKQAPDIKVVISKIEQLFGQAELLKNEGADREAITLAVKELHNSISASLQDLREASQSYRFIPPPPKEDAAQ